MQQRNIFRPHWQAPAGWSLAQVEIDGKKTTVLNIRGGGEGLSVQGELEDFDFRADFRPVAPRGDRPLHTPTTAPRPAGPMH